MSNSPWTKIEDAPVPQGETVLLYLAKERHGSRFALSKGFKISNGYSAVIDGLFHFDFTTPVLAWRRLSDLERELPLELTDE